MEDIKMTEATENITEFAVYAPPADVIENDAGIKVVLDVPGASAELLEVEVEDRVLKVKADTDEIKSGKPVRYQRAFQISDEINATKIKAVVKDGILTIDLPKAESAKVHKVTVKSE
jgi:HSP20 family protein